MDKPLARCVRSIRPASCRGVANGFADSQPRGMDGGSAEPQGGDSCHPSQPTVRRRHRHGAGKGALLGTYAARWARPALACPIDISALNVLPLSSRHGLQGHADRLGARGLQREALIACLTCHSAEQLNLLPGSSVFAVVKGVAFDRQKPRWPNRRRSRQRGSRNQRRMSTGGLPIDRWRGRAAGQAARP
jgi:hypothetical protein